MHPSKPATGQCHGCGAPLCPRCMGQARRSGEPLCGDCLRADAATRPRVQRVRQTRLVHISRWGRWLAICAVLVVVVSGTWLTLRLAQARLSLNLAQQPMPPREQTNLQEATQKAREAIGQTQQLLVRGTGGWMENIGKSLVQIRTEGLDAGQGSGFFVSTAGDIFTAAHVVSDNSRVDVYLQDGRCCEGQVLRTDSAADTALVRIDRSGTCALPLGDSTRLPVGADILVAGFPISQVFEASGLQALTPTVAQGIVSAQQSRHSSPYSRAVRLLQIDANVNPGHSGGPVFSRASGEVVGIISSGMVGADGRTGICFASPIEYARALLPQPQL